MNQKIAEVYQENEVNPLAGCIPSIAQIPIFIGLYRAVLTLAKDNALDESFFFLPSLEGPTYGALLYLCTSVENLIWAVSRRRLRDTLELRDEIIQIELRPPICIHLLQVALRV